MKNKKPLGSKQIKVYFRGRDVYFYRLHENNLQYDKKYKFPKIRFHFELLAENYNLTNKNSKIDF